MIFLEYEVRSIREKALDLDIHNPVMDQVDYSLTQMRYVNSHDFN